MSRHGWIGQAGWLGAAAWVLLCTTAMGAQGPPGISPSQPAQQAVTVFMADAGGAPQPIKHSDYWLGIEACLVPPPLRLHLNLAEGEGILVEHVLPDRPAAKAGIKPHDILLKAGGKPLKGIGDLFAALDDAKDKELSLELLRAGKSLKITAKPERRPAQGEGSLAWQNRMPWPADADLDTVRKWFEEHYRPGEPGRWPMRLQFFHPGAILPPGAPLQPPLPGNLSVSISKTGNDPAKIVVTRDGNKWEITEKELDKLPADVRPHVERMLGRGVLGVGGMGAGGFGVFFEGAPTPVGEPPRPAPKGPQLVPVLVPPGDPSARLERRLEQMDRRIEQLFKSLEQMRQPAPGKAPDKKTVEKKPGERV